MGSFGYLLIGGRPILSFRDHVDPTFLMLFTEDDLVRATRSGERPHSGLDEDETFEAFELVTTAGAMRERLEVLGVGLIAATRRVREAMNQRVELTERLDARFPAPKLNEWHAEERSLLTSTDAEAFGRAVFEEVARGHVREDRPRVGSLSWWLELLEDLDSRHLLRAAVEDLAPTTELVLDVTDLEDGGWFETGDIRAAALEHFGWAIHNGAPAIVLAEGRTDIEFLSRALAVRRPHLSEFIRFADFTTGTEGGAGALVRVVRTFAAAGIANRVVAIFDNDAAATDAMRQLRTHELPPHIRVMQLPTLELARTYPAIGPTGMTETDVNGLAGSIELYLGRDALTRADGMLSAVQWKGYLSTVGLYQGEVTDKAEVHRRFRQKLEDADASADWSGIDAILDALIKVLRD